MPDIPPELAVGRVVGRFLAPHVDGTSAVPVSGSVTLTPLVSTSRWPSATPPVMVAAQRVVCPVIDGDLYAPGTTEPGGSAGVDLVATDQPEGSPTTIQWRAAFRLRDADNPPPVVFDVPAGGTVDLTTVIPATPTPGTVTVVSHEDRLAAEAAAVRATAPTDETVAGLIPASSGSQTAGAVAATIDSRRITYRDLPASGVWFGHHGGGVQSYGSAPVDSLAAMRYTTALGASILDIDVRATADGVLVCHHDVTTAETCVETVTIADTMLAHLPPLQQARHVGAGWGSEPIPTLEQVLQEFGGRAVLSIELKGGSWLLDQVGALVRRHKCGDSVYINFLGSAGAAISPDVLGQGLLVFRTMCSTVEMVEAAIAGGATLISIPSDASEDVIVAAQAIHDVGGRVIAEIRDGVPIYGLFRKGQVAALDPRIDGYSSDVPGYTERSASLPPLSNSIAGALRSQRVAPGWCARNPFQYPAREDRDGWLSPQGVLIAAGGVSINVQLRDFGGTPPSGSGSITFGVNFETLPAVTTQYVGMRLLCETDNAASNSESDPAHQGYSVDLRANGAITVWSVNPLTNALESIGTTPASPLTAGTEYQVRVDWTPDTITATRVDTGATTGPIADKRYRGTYAHLRATLTTGRAYVTAVERAFS